MKYNIYNLFMTFSKPDREYYYKIFRDVTFNNKESNLCMIHIPFDHNDKIDNIEYEKKGRHVDIFYINSEQFIHENTTIKNLDDIAKIFKKNNIFEHNVFVYSGHSDGLFFNHRNVLYMTINNYCDVIKKTIGSKPSDFLILDACLLGNLNLLNICNGFTKYIISAPSYYDMASIMSTPQIYMTNLGGNIEYGKKVINGYVKMLEKTFTIKKFPVNMVLYDLTNNSRLNAISKFITEHKYEIKHTCCSLNKNDRYHVDAIKAIKLLDKKYEKEGAKIIKKINNLVLYQKIINNNDENMISKLLIIMKKPNNYSRTIGDIFFKIDEY